MAVIHMSQNVAKTVSSRSKFIQTRAFWIRDQVTIHKTITMEYTKTTENVSDIMTKNLPEPTFTKFASRCVADLTKTLDGKETEPAKGELGARHGIQDTIVY